MAPLGHGSRHAALLGASQYAREGISACGPSTVPVLVVQSSCLLSDGPYTWASFLHATRTSQSVSSPLPPNPVH